MVIIQLLADHKIGDTTYEAGRVLRVESKAQADNLIKSKVAKLIHDGENDGHPDNGDVQPEPETTKATTTSETESRLEAATKRIGELEGVLNRMATTPRDPMKPGVVDSDRANKASHTRPRWEDDPSLGYGSIEEVGYEGAAIFFLDVAAAAKGEFDSSDREKHYRETQKCLRNRLMSRPVVTSAHGIEFKAVGSDEHSTAEMSRGGALVPVEYRTDVLTNQVVPEIARSNNAIIMPISGGAITFPVTKDFDRSGGAISGIQVYRDHERVAATTSRAEFFQFTLTPQRLSGAGHITGYELALAPQIAGLLLGEMGKAVTQKMNREHIKGDGGGEAKGVLNQTAAYSVTRTTASKIEPDDIVEMYARQVNPTNAVWLAPQSAFGEIMLMTKTIGVGGALVVMQNVTEGPVLSILGRPIIFNEFSPALGSAGDLMFVDFSNYMIGESGYRKADRTMFVRYLEDQDTYRLIMYNTANSWWPSTIKNDSGYEQSPFVKLSA